MLDLIKQGLGVMIALLVAFFVLRPILKGLLKPAPLAMNNVALAGPMPTVSVMVDDDDMTPDRVSTSSQCPARFARAAGLRTEGGSCQAHGRRESETGGAGREELGVRRWRLSRKRP